MVAFLLNRLLHAVAVLFGVVSVDVRACSIWRVTHWRV